MSAWSVFRTPENPRLSRASPPRRPKIADYAFTTLEPIWAWSSSTTSGSFVVADLPGLIEGAHAGAGLGIQFLRHIERTRLLAHLVDLSESTGRQPEEDFEIIMRELASFSQELAQKPMIVVAAKMDAARTRSGSPTCAAWPKSEACPSSKSPA